jgi:hypothetical protein
LSGRQAHTRGSPRRFVVEVHQDGRLVRIGQLQDPHLRDGVVRNLPAGAARAALDPVVALAKPWVPAIINADGIAESSVDVSPRRPD